MTTWSLSVSRALTSLQYGQKEEARGAEGKRAVSLIMSRKAEVSTYLSSSPTAWPDGAQ